MGCGGGGAGDRVVEGGGDGETEGGRRDELRDGDGGAGTSDVGMNLQTRACNARTVRVRMCIQFTLLSYGDKNVRHRCVRWVSVNLPVGKCYLQKVNRSGIFVYNSSKLRECI